MEGSRRRWTKVGLGQNPPTLYGSWTGRRWREASEGVVGKRQNK